MAGEIKKIDGDDYPVRSILSNRYRIDYYQREYRWERRHVEALLLDLEARFTATFTPGDSRVKVQEYSRYFLGPIVVSHKDGSRFLIDGQQRLTSLTLLLIHLDQIQKDREDKVRVDDLIYSERYGKKSFHIDVEERRDCMLALFEGRDPRQEDKSGSVPNLVARFNDIVDLFPDDLGSPEVLPHFIDWLLDNVILVEISTYNDEDAYAIFETMNDRGLSLTPVEMLKAYLLSKLDQDETRAATDVQWKTWMADLTDRGKDEDADFFKSWLRARYAQGIREGVAGATNQDFELIGSGFHKWVRDNADQSMGLKRSSEFRDFVHTPLPKAIDAFKILRDAEETLTPGLEYLFYNRVGGFSLQAPLLLAAVNDEDSEATIREKYRLVAGFIDIFVFRRVINLKSRSGRALSYTMFTLMKELRGASTEQVAETMYERARALDDDTPIDAMLTFYLHQQNRPQVRNLLARLTAHIQQECNAEGTFAHYVARNSKDPFEVEHVIADMPERLVPSVFSDNSEFDSKRNQLGALLLVPKSFNASYGALPYEEKQQHYNAQNLLARSLCEESYERNPNFVRFIESSGLDFQPHSEFLKEQVDQRQGLYRDLASQIWSLDRFTVS